MSNIPRNNSEGCKNKFNYKKFLKNMPLIKPQDKVFVAGHRGMVGSSIVRALNKNNYKNILTVSKEDLDLRNQNNVDKWFSYHRPDVVILAAAKVGGIGANSTYPVEFLLDNIKIQSNVIESAWRNGSHRLLFLGSSCIYPKHAKQPIIEEELLEGALEKTNEWYAIAKITGIKLCEALRDQYGFDALSLMPTNLYGPGDNYHPENSHVIPALIKKFSDAVTSKSKVVTCWGSGTPFREFLHVDDLASACIFSLERWDTNLTSSPKDHDGKILTHLNVGTGRDIPLRDLAQKIASLCKFKGIIEWDQSKPDGTPKKLLNIERLKQLGWTSKISLSEGLKKTVENYKKEGMNSISKNS